MKVIVDSSELNKWLANMKNRGRVGVRKAVRRYTNKMAFSTRELAVKKTMNQAFSFMANKTKKWSKKPDKVAYVPAKKSSDIDKMVASVGALGDIDGSNVISRAGGFLARQELGGVVKQLKTGESGFRGKMLLRNKSEIGSKQVKKIKSSDLVKVKKTHSKSVAFAVAKREAILRGKHYMSTDNGIFKVPQRSAISYVTKKGKFRMKKLPRVKLIYGLGKVGDVKVSKNPWLKPATNLAINNRFKLAKETIDFIREELQKK